MSSVSLTDSSATTKLVTDLGRHGWVRTAGSTYTAEVQTAVSLALSCGAAMVTTSASARSATLKDGDDGGIDPVTQTDVANEQLVTAVLRERYPSHAVVGEESSSVEGRIPEIDPGTPTWVVDPVDGTQNFVHALPLSCVSIGLCINGMPTLGVVYDPYRDELFVGVVGEAAYLNGERIHADASCVSLDKAVVATDLGYERAPAGVARIAGAHAALLSANIFAIRIFGSTVLSVVWVAAGRANGFYSGLASRDCPKSWDWCAATAIGVAAGIAFRRFDSEEPFAFTAPSGLCCACSAQLADALEATLRRVTGGAPVEQQPCALVSQDEER